MPIKAFSCKYILTLHTSHIVYDFVILDNGCQSHYNFQRKRHIIKYKLLFDWSYIKCFFTNKSVPFIFECDWKFLTSEYLKFPVFHIGKIIYNWQWKSLHYIICNIYFIKKYQLAKAKIWNEKFSGQWLLPEK